MLFSILVLTFTLTIVSCTNGSNEKRIPLSDPAYIQQELTRFQSELQDLQVKYNSLQSLQTTVTNLESTVVSQNAIIKGLQDDRGALFTRWGRSDCLFTNTTTLVYSGYAGGSYYDNTGAAADYVCMPSDPIWGPYKDYAYGDSVGFMFGAEYKEPAHIFGMPNTREDVPCAVCLGLLQTTTLMIPGRTQCYPGWIEAYYGVLASGYHGHAAASQYVCVDQHPQALPAGGTHDENGKLFYGVKARCGSLPCPPYEEGKFLPCVVCMK